MAGTDLITHSLGGKTVMQRESDGYISATAMCKAAGKKLNDYKRLENTKEYLEELASITGIPAIELIKQYGNNRKMGTWVHPKVAIHLAQWLSPKFAVRVTNWVHDWMMGSVEGKQRQLAPLNPQPNLPMQHKLISVNPNTGEVITHEYSGKILVIPHETARNAVNDHIAHGEKLQKHVNGMVTAFQDLMLGADMIPEALPQS